MKHKRKKALWVSVFPNQVKAGTRKKKGRKTITKERRLEIQVYTLKARQFLADLRKARYTCPVIAAYDQLPPEMQKVLVVPWTGNLRSNRISECHHRYGRRGVLLLWTPGWIGLSKFGHRAVHMFPQVARQFGWLAPAGQWEDQTLVANNIKPNIIAYPKK